ncbi:hypothetical protein BKA70DRAFT_465103 [Coprinopsis sp. MPI-PUGE-AT-0042]|nr:hypothetical protein BKA70DRAFT_465103 [Coprinopsis sp. MPI-PUGE-AT-0042]
MSDRHITRETFIAEDYERIAATQTETMVREIDDSGNAITVKVPRSIKQSGKVPEGYSVDFVMDPIMMVGFAESMGMTMESDFPPEMLEKLKGIISGPDNLKIIPTELCDAKLALMTSTASSMAAPDGGSEA